MNAPTRGAIERRATGGNGVHEVPRITLSNAMPLAKLIPPGEPPRGEVVATDFVRATAVSRQGDRPRPLDFDPPTLLHKP